MLIARCGRANRGAQGRKQGLICVVIRKDHAVGGAAANATGGLSEVTSIPSVRCSCIWSFLNLRNNFHRGNETNGLRFIFSEPENAIGIGLDQTS